MADTAPGDATPSIELEVLEMVVHDGLRALEDTWQAEDAGGAEPAGGWSAERDRIRRTTRLVVLYALVVDDVAIDEVARIARSLQGSGMSDPLADELQAEGLGALVAEFRERLAGAGGDSVPG